MSLAPGGAYSLERKLSPKAGQAIHRGHLCAGTMWGAGGPARGTCSLWTLQLSVGKADGARDQTDPTSSSGTNPVVASPAGGVQGH